MIRELGIGEEVCFDIRIFSILLESPVWDMAFTLYSLLFSSLVFCFAFFLSLSSEFILPFCKDELSHRDRLAHYLNGDASGSASTNLTMTYIIAALAAIIVAIPTGLLKNVNKLFFRTPRFPAFTFSAC